MIRVLAVVAFLWAAPIGLASHRDDHSADNEDVTISCDRFEDEGHVMVVRCNLTDHRTFSRTCPPHSILLPPFDKATVVCRLIMVFPFTNSRLECSILKGHSRAGKEIMRANSTLFIGPSQRGQLVWDGLVEFESIFKNPLAIGEVFARCIINMLSDDLVSCGLFGIGDGASVVGNLSCTMVSSSRDTYSTNVLLCGFSEDHNVAKLRGNLTITMKSFYEEMKISADATLVARSNSPFLPNVFENLRLGCQVDNTQKTPTGEGILVCKAYLNEGRFCEGSCCPKRVKGKEVKNARDQIWELERTVNFDMDISTLGNVKVVCNMAEDIQARILKCYSNVENGSVAFCQKTIVKVTFVNSRMAVDTMSLARIYIEDMFSFNGIIIRHCEMKLNPNDTEMSCNFHFRRKRPINGDFTCRFNEPLSEKFTGDYSVSCEISLGDRYSIDARLSLSTNEDNQARLLMNGQVRNNDKPDMSQEIKYSCNASPRNRTESLTDAKEIDVKCKVDVGSAQQMCEMFPSFCDSEDD